MKRTIIPSDQEPIMSLPTKVAVDTQIIGRNGGALNKKKSFKRYNNFLSMFDSNRPVWNSTDAFLRL